MRDKRSRIKVPSKWADDPLSDFFGRAFSNSLGNFVRLPGEFGLLLRIHRTFLSIDDRGLSNASDLSVEPLLRRSRAAFLGAAWLVTSGQVPETFALLRSCLEHALYALHIHQNPDLELGELWLRRHDSDASLRAMRTVFQHVAVMKTLENCDAKLHATLEKLYQRTVDADGHPDERGIAGSTLASASPGRKMCIDSHLHDNPIVLRAGMKAAAQAGAGALSIFEKIFGQRFEILEILGISTDLTELQREL